MARLTSDEHKALTVIQCSWRCILAKRELQQLRAWFEEEQRWRQALKRRRQRIERLEQELHHVESLPAADLDHYAETARSGLRGMEAAILAVKGSWREAAALTLQGFFRVQLRRRRGAAQRLEHRNKAARMLQSFFKKYTKLRKQRYGSQPAIPYKLYRGGIHFLSHRHLQRNAAH